MTHPKGLAAMLLAALVFAGCSGSDDPTQGTGGDEPGRTGGPGGGTTVVGTETGGTGGTPRPGPGSGTVVTFTRAEPDGTIPLTLNFTVSATLDGANATGSWIAMQQMTANATGAPTPSAKAARVGSGSNLPGRFTVTLTEGGTYKLTTTVTPKNGAPASANVTVVARVPPPPPTKPPIFSDGAETDGSQFTISSNVLVAVTSTTMRELDQEYPDHKWSQVTDQVHGGGKSWFSGYPDNYRTRLETLPFEATAAGAKLAFWYRGGAEDNSIDGLHVLAGPDADKLETLASFTGALVEWTQASYDLPAGTTVVQFRFDADPSCSADTELPAGCGEGDFVGYWLDDILVAAAP